jgi:hypothetical protein
LFPSNRCFHQIAPAPASLPPLLLPCSPTLALDIIVVAAPLVNCRVAAALAIVNLGCRCLNLMFRPFGWWPWYDGGHHGPWAMVLMFSRIVLFDSTWPKQSYQFLRLTGSHFIRKSVLLMGRISRDAEKALPDVIFFEPNR